MCRVQSLKKDFYFGAPSSFDFVFTLTQLCFQNNAFNMNSGFLQSNIWTNQLIELLRNSKIHLEFYSKLFIMTTHGLKNEIIKLNVKSFLWSLNQMVVMNFWKLRIRLWNGYFFIHQFFCAQWVHNQNVLMSYFYELFGFFF